VKLLAGVLLLVLFVGGLWASDRITLQGERTVFTVDCKDGSWQQNVCTGRLVPGNRYTFRASRSRQEVLYWIVGSSSPSGRYTGCRVENRGNWTCSAMTGQPPTITYAMKDDQPTPGPAGVVPPFHAVPKWKWWAIRYGIGRFNESGV
jgi:hypothetical protein